MVMQSTLPQGVRLNPRNTFEVCQGMSIQAAINAAAAQVPAPSATNPWTILIYPGIYTEAITYAPWVNLKGIGPKGSVVIAYDAGTFVTLATGSQEMSNLTLRMPTPNGNWTFIFGGGGVTGTAKFSDVIFEVTTPAARDLYLCIINNAITVTFERCSCNIGGTGTHTAFRTQTVAGTLILLDNDFEFNANVASPFLYITIGSTVRGKGNRWAGTGYFIYATAGTVTLDHDAILCPSAWNTMTGVTMYLRHCEIVPAILAGNTTLIRLKNCSYRTISRTGTGNIVDESPVLMDAPWKVHKWTWQAVLAQAQVSIRGTPKDAGTGQVLLEVTDNKADQEAVERFAEIAGALGNEFTPARTPRFLTQIAVDSFDAQVTMFFGLRATLGNAVPAHPEHHAGFIWTGAAFNASSNDGAATQTTVLATPSTDAQHQLEVIVFGGVTTVGKVEFYVDGVLVATHPTRIPVNGLDWQHLLATAGGGTGDLIQVTVRQGGCQECPA